MCQMRQATKLPMGKKKVNLTMYATSIDVALLHDVLRLACVESGTSAGSEDHLVAPLAGANS